MGRMQHEQSHHHHHRLLHSFRSHKTLRADAESQEMHHHRNPSEASSVARSSTDSARPSTSRTDMSVEWDPLRLHPPMASAPSPVFPSTHSQESRRYEPHELRQARAQHNTEGRTHSRAVHSQSSPTMVIYDGFDFGFSQQAPRRRTSPAPSSSGSEFEAATPESRGAEWGPVTPRPHPATNSPDYFIKRGDWKRRGIVFGGGETTMASEAETFDLDM
ncbi:hypothetical protein B0T25DRAFT_562371 [Lasiosphaeria hispida]|uniref:Uncharacterized protein n=1 Tax=Lasiosphaeria hispida TaxID=260671 RepID=A0AAJ0HUW6_9PEZI|nr:hypothetical protein B0T25DRAFT_562371 [Lasiosphaeria hispida]